VDSPRITLGRLVDVRNGEWRPALVAFGVLLLTSGAYAVLETARDALLVTYLPQHDFGVAYIAVAVFALPVAGILTALGQHLDPRRVLLAVLAVSASASVVWYGLPVTRGSVVAFYVFVGLVASSVYPQFWLLMGGSLTVGQSRRLFGPIGSAGVVGGALGASAAAALVSWVTIRSLPLIAATLLAAAAVIALSIAPPPPKLRAAEQPKVKLVTLARTFSAEPFLMRVGILVVLTTATALAIDYFFKWTVARSLPHAARGVFVARYYAVVNGAALVVQLFLGSALVRRLGVGMALEVTPLLSVVGGSAVLIGGAAIAPVLVLKGVDSSLRSSLNRLTTELVYLPVSPAGRARAKPFVDGALVRIAQAVTAGILLLIATMHELSPRIFASVVVLLAVAWFAGTLWVRSAYLGQLRQSVASADTRGPSDAEPLDIAGAELLIESLGSDDPLMVISAMNTLARRGRPGLIAALILRHTDERVLERGLEILGATSRSDWYRLAGDLLRHDRERVRLASARALATHGKLDARKLDADTAPSVHGYVTLLAALDDGPEDVAGDLRLVALMNDNESDFARLGILAAIADAPPSHRVLSLLGMLAAREWSPGGAAWTELLARAAVRHHDVSMVPRLIALLSRRAGRESVREALVALGEPALEAVAQAFEDPLVDRKIRVHLPRTLAHFGTKWAADKLLEGLERIADGRVRYKALRALGRMIGRGQVRLDRARVERIAHTNLASHLHLLGLRVALGGPPPPENEQAAKTYTLFAGLLDDKLRQSLERAFRLLKIAHPREDIHRVYLACLSSDRRSRANAGEFLDALLRRRDQEELRELFRIVSDDLVGHEQVTRAAQVLELTPPRSREEAVRAAVADPDVKLATLAALYADATGEGWLRAALALRPVAESAASDQFQEALTQLRSLHA
jgi:AAA family ATP:ADP antiporter